MTHQSTINVFSIFADKVATKFKQMTKNNQPLFVSGIEKDELWNLYLESIPEKENPIFRTNRYYDANYDKNFIRHVGRLMTIENNQLVSVWDVKDDSFFGDVTKVLSKAVKESGIARFYATKERTAGHKPSLDNYDKDLVWTHFYTEIPETYRVTSSFQSPEEVSGKINTNASVLKRSITEVSKETIKTVLELIEDNSIYRGFEHKATLENWLTHISNYKKAKNPDLYVWEKATGSSINLRNTVIGSLIVDLEDGVDLESAVKSFEAKVAPSNYKRTQSIVTSKMIKDAQEKLTELGLLDSIERRFAIETDIPREQILFTSQEVKALNVFDDLVADAKKSTKKVDVSKAKTILLQDFLSKLNDYQQVELLPLAAISGQQMVLTTEAKSGSKPLFKWDNPFAWAYINSDTTDAIKARVKEMGGNVDADVRVSLSWHTSEDLDLHAHDGRDSHVYYSHKRGMGAYLDLDMNGLDKHDSDNPVENLIWLNQKDFPNNKVKIKVDHYSGHNNDPKRYGFDLQVEIMGAITTYRFESKFTGSNVHFLSLVRKNGTIVIEDVHKSLKLVSQTTVDAQFITVDHVLLSPNYWDAEVGNKHIFFTTKDFDLEQDVRGFFNEYLDNDLNQHRKVFEILGNRTKISDNKENALRGYGFSTTMDNQLIVRATTASGRQDLFNISVK